MSSLESLPCGCDFAVRDGTRLAAIAQEYFANGCGKDAVCPNCPRTGALTLCEDGTCVLGGYR